jgi:hypothetical protein
MNATQCVFQSKPRDRRTYKARQHHVSAASSILFCYDGLNWKDLLPQVEFAYNVTRALGIDYTPFEAYFGYSREEPLDLLFSMRPSIPVSQDA